MGVREIPEFWDNNLLDNNIEIIDGVTEGS